MPQPRELFEGLPAPAPGRDAQTIRDLGDGLVLRRACPDDVEAVCAFNAVVHADPPDWKVTRLVGEWTRELMDGRHPRCCADDFVLVHDTRRNRLASSLCLLSHRLRYGDVPFDAGQVELVGTHPDYRRRGLVAAQFAVVHAWSQERGQRLQLVDGIPWYYRQFGYEMALEEGGHRVAFPAALETRSEERDPSLRVRPARAADAPLIGALYGRGVAGHAVSCERDADFWRYEIEARDPGSMQRKEIRVVEREGGPPLAVFAHPPILFQGWLHVNLAEVAPDAAWSGVLPTLLHTLRTTADCLAEAAGPDLRGVIFRLGSEHPIYHAAGRRLAADRPPYAFYVRVPDLPVFLRLLGPELEARLAASPLAGHSGELALSFYRSGVRLRLAGGRLEEVSPWTPATDDRGDVALPDLTFLQLLFGFRSLDELDTAFPDCFRWQEDRAPLVDALFPKRPSDLWPTL